MQNTAQKIKEMREKSNYTQDYMAEQLGITQESYSKIELGKTKLMVNRLLKIAEVLEMSLFDFFDFDEKIVFNNHSKSNQQNGIVLGGSSEKEKELYEKIIAVQQITIDAQQKEIEFLKSIVEHLKTSSVLHEENN